MTFKADDYQLAIIKGEPMPKPRPTPAERRFQLPDGTKVSTRSSKPRRRRIAKRKARQADRELKP